MSRRHSAEKRQVLPDPKFGDVILSKFINSIMTGGKKSTAESIVYGALEEVRAKAKLANDNDVIDYFHKALEKVRPQLEVKSRRIGGATYQVPVEVRSERAQAVAMRWVKAAARARGARTMMARLAAELLDIANDRGAALKKRDDTHKMAEANKAFAHYR